MANEKPLIQVSPESKDKLDKIGNKGDTYDDIIKRLLDLAEKK